MLSESDKLKPAALILWKTDRLGRDRCELVFAKERIRNAGCKIYYVAEGLAEYQNIQLSQNITRGMRYNAKNALSNGHKILGYKVDENKKISSTQIKHQLYSEYMRITHRETAC